MIRRRVTQMQPVGDSRRRIRADSNGYARHTVMDINTAFGSRRDQCATRLLAELKNATYRPSGVISGVSMVPFDPMAPTLTSQVVCVIKSRTKTSGIPFVSPATKLVAALMKATQVPSGVMTGTVEAPLPKPPSAATLMRPGDASVGVAQKDVADPVRVARHKVAGVALEHHITVVVGNLAEHGSPLPPPLPLGTGADFRVVVPPMRSRRKMFRANLPLALVTRTAGRTAEDHKTPVVT